MNNYLIGTDITVIRRFETLKENKKFLKKVFTEKERAYIARKSYDCQTVAGLFAAKEAAAKALKTGIGVLSFQDVEITHDNGIEIRFSEKCHVKEADISITHDGVYAQAVCILRKYHGQTDAPFRIPKRLYTSHKGDFGKVGIIGGSRGMCGSVFLSQMAALRSGSGLVYNIVPECISDILQIKSIENIVIPAMSDGDYFHINALDDIVARSKPWDAVAIGPGMGRFENAFFFLKELLQHIKQKIVIDADGLHALSYDPSILKMRDALTTVLTPHAQEMARLVHRTAKEVNQNRVEIALSYAREYECVVVLKGHHTIVTDGKEVYMNATGNAGMATAGSGDVLTGMIASLLANYSAMEAAKMAVYLHGSAGDFAKWKYGEESLIARDIIEQIPFAIQQIKEG